MNDTRITDSIVFGQFGLKKKIKLTKHTLTDVRVYLSFHYTNTDIVTCDNPSIHRLIIKKASLKASDQEQAQENSGEVSQNGDNRKLLSNPVNLSNNKFRVNLFF